MNVYILTEGGFDTGFGHIMRCLSICQALEEKHIFPEFIINGDNSVGGFLSGKKYQIFNWIKKEDKLLKLLDTPDLVIIDSYLSDVEVYKKVFEISKTCAYIDDYKRLVYPPGIIINGAIFAEDLNYPANDDYLYLIGNNYSLLRKDFWKISKKIINPQIENIMITFGGSDLNNLSLVILELLCNKFPEYNKIVIIGKNYNNHDQLKKLSSNKVNLFYNVDSKEMRKIMLKSDLVISGGGQTLYELAMIGVPTIAVAVADNQMNNINGWNKANFIEYAGYWNDSNLQDNIVSLIYKMQDYSLRQKKCRIGKIFIDGLGARRIVRCFYENYFSNK